MKILIDAFGIINETTGVGQYSLQLLNALSEIDNSNKYYICIQKGLHENHPTNKLRDKKNIFFFKDNIPAIGPRKQLYFFNLFRKNPHRFDLFHSFNSELALYGNIKSVVTFHDLKYIRYPFFLNNFSRIKSGYLRCVMKKGAKKANKIIAVSENTKKDLVQLLGINRDKISVIYEASNLGIYSQEGNSISNCDILKKYSIQKPFFLYVGEKRPHKNLDGLIKAFKIYKEKYDQKNISLVLTGKKYSNYDGYLNTAKKLGIRNNLILTGFVSEKDLKTIYSEAESLLLISFYEGFGIPILEAMECRIPVITSNISSMPEVAGEAALLVDPNNITEIAENMNRITSSKKIREALVEKGLKRAKQFSWKKTARKTLEVYDGVYKQ
jgi:glycosyltransferase involved in cell wall biosynthesis